MDELFLNPCLPQEMSLVYAILCAIKFLILHGAIIFFSYALARVYIKEAEFIPKAIATGMIYFLTLSLPLWFLPISWKWLMAWSIICGVLGVGLSFKPRKIPPQNPQPEFIELAGIIAIIVFALGLLLLGIFSPCYEHDPLTYQLYFPAQWLSQGKISIIPTPFGDPSQAYGPALVSMFYLWLIAPIGNDILAQTGQWAFLLLTILSMLGLAQELGAKKNYLFGLAFLMFSAPLLVSEAKSALSDLALSGFFSSAIYFFFRTIRTKQRINFVFALLASGLCAGCKYTSIPLLSLLLPLLMVAGWESWDKNSWRIWLLGVMTALLGGGIWYVRNWVLSGNPVFPIKVSIAGIELFSGIYGKEEMVNWIFHQTGINNWLKILLTNFSPLLLGMGIIAIIATPIIMVLRSRKKELENKRGEKYIIIYLSLIPILIDRIYWNWIPFQVDRFWLPAVPIICALLASVCSQNKALVGTGLALAYAGLFLVPPNPNLDQSTLNWVKIFYPLALALGAGLAWLCLKLWTLNSKSYQWGKNHHWRGLRFGFKTTLFLSIILFWAVIISIGLRTFEFRRNQAFAQSFFGKAWLSLPCPEDGIIIAYSGRNMPYPLFGTRLKNQVVYISNSGELMPKDHQIWKKIKEHPPKFFTPEPGLSNLKLNPHKWAKAMIDYSVDYLFIMRLSYTGLIYLPHNQEGWPIIESWAHSAPSMFSLIYQDNYTKIYKINRAQTPPFPDQDYTLPSDGIAVCEKNPEPSLCQKFYPLTSQAIKLIRLKNF